MLVTEKTVSFMPRIPRAQKKVLGLRTLFSFVYKLIYNINLVWGLYSYSKVRSNNDITFEGLYNIRSY